jgi:hypothetical protein
MRLRIIKGKLKYRKWRKGGCENEKKAMKD